MPLFENKPVGRIQKEYKTNMGFYRHLHSSIELCFVLEGQVVCEVGKNRVTAHSGDALMIFPYQIHEYPRELNENGRFILLTIPLEVYKSYRSEIAHFLPLTPLIPQFAKHNEINSLLEIIVAAEDSGIPYQMCKGFTIGILGAALQNAELNPRTNKQDDLLAKVLEYCNDHYKEKLTLSQLANQFYVNQSGLSRLFNHGLGLSFNDFINLLRVEEAIHLLTTTSLTVSQIAFEVGFSNVRTMNRAFIKHQGVAPYCLRTRQREETTWI